MTASTSEVELPAEEEVRVAPPNPAGFRLSGELPRVMRLSRKTFAIIGGVSGLAIGGALFWALRPSAPDIPPNLHDSERPNWSEIVTGAAADYGAVPRLGPPLPEDLGRPIVAAGPRGENVPALPIGEPSADSARTAAEQQREAARASRLFLGGVSAAERGTPVPEAGAPPVPGTTNRDTSVNSRRAFMEGNGGRPIESAARIVAPSSPHIIQAGSVIPAALITGISSDLPGQITAQVTQNVYDSPTGRTLLIPQGARLIGEYDSEVASGQSRVLLAWDRLILPGGRSISLERLPGADAAGRAGIEDRIDNHWGRMLRAALISSLLGVGSEVVSGGDSDLVRALRSGVQDGTNEAGRRVVERELSVPPTLTIRPGFVFRVIVTRDLVLAPAEPGGGR